MNAYLPSNDIELWHIAGWTMIHFLWLGALVAAVALVCRLLLRRAAPNVRYVAALGCLMLLAAQPIGIAAWLINNSPPLQGGVRGGFVGDIKQVAAADGTQIIELSDPESALPAPPKRIEVNITGPRPANTEPSPDPSLTGRGISFAALKSFVPYLPWLWIIGTPITFALLAAGIIGTERLRRASHVIDDGPITDLLARLAASLRMGKRVSIAVCDRIAAPVLVGILRPIILLPPASLTGWSPDEIEMVLLHELAHVRRWDNLVNLLQRCIESLLFFHPAVWLISNWVRREREACCDAIVVGRTHRPHAYAEMLVALAAQLSEPGRPRPRLFTRGRGRPGSLVSAMAAGPLRQRIRRILQLEDDPMLISGKSFALMLAGLLVAATLAVLYLPTIGQAEESTIEATESTETSDPEPKDLAKANDSESSDKARFARFEKALDEISLVVVLFNDTGRYYPHLQNVYNELVRRGETIYLYGMKMDPDSQGAQRYGIKNTPTLIIFRKGKEVARLDGIQSTEQIRALVAAVGLVSDTPRDDEARQRNPEIDLLHRIIADLERKKTNLEIELHELQKEFDVTKRKPDDPRLIDMQVDHIMAQDEAMFMLQQQLVLAEMQLSRSSGRRGRAAAAVEQNVAQLRNQIAQYRGQVKAQLERDKNSKPNAALQELTKEFQVRLETIRRNLEAVEKQLQEKTEQLQQQKAETAEIYPSIPVEATHDSKTPTSAEFPHTVRFERGASKFMPGDSITVLEVRGTDKTFEPGNRYWIRGEYTLASRDKAALSAFTTAKDAADGRSSVLPIQTTQVNRGEGTFTLILPMSHRGWPHVSFYPAEGGNGFGGTYFGTGDSVLKKWWGTDEVVDQTSTSSPTDTRDSRFPSLEDQKLADLAWKRLQLELEPIRDDDLKRVKALGYEGGLRVSGKPRSVAKISADQVGESILTGDILVGLHVWPTRSMKDVAAVLAREDLAELNPLKFYVVREEFEESALGQPPTLVGDSIVTGRVSVYLGSGGRFGAAGGTFVRPGARYSQQPAATAPDADPYAAPAKPVAAASDSEVPSYVLPTPEEEAAAPAKSRAMIPGIATSSSPYATPLPGAATMKSNLRYDGKTFEEWRDLWKYELSTEKRLEAVKALAAFGANGYGREAAETILDVAAEYDSGNFNHNPLLQAIRDGLISIEPANAWLPLLRKRFESDPKKWQRLAIETISGAPAADEQAKNEKHGFLLLLTRSDDDGISSAAIAALVPFDPALENEAIKRLVMDQLHSNQYHLVAGVINQFTMYAPQYPPEVVELLLHGDERQQTTLHRALSRTTGPWEPLIALSAELIAVLKDDAKAVDHLAAIRALAAVGETATRGQINVRDVLEKIAKKGKLEHQIAAAFALEMMTRGKTQAVPLLDGEARDAAGRKLSALEIQTLLEKEKQAVFGNATANGTFPGGASRVGLQINAID